MENFAVTCPLCKKPVHAKWDNGIITTGDVVLIADWLYHYDCWYKIEKNYVPPKEEIDTSHE